jgi:hypothetical protein
MANCSNLFLEFDTNVKLTEARKESLRTSRNDVRKKIKAYLEELHIPYDFSFKGHGSYKMNTIVNPLDGNYDMDDGIYFKVEKEPDETVQTFHDWIFEAVDGHTNDKPTDRNPCITVRFADGHHLDLVIFYQKANEHPRLAHKSKGWIESDPDEFYNWVNARADGGGQLKRLVRYMKAWSDYRKGDMPSGLILTILCSDNVCHSERDDQSFLDTLIKIRSVLKMSFVCYRPTTPTYQNLFEDYSLTRQTYFLGALDSIIGSGEQAVNEPNQKDACPKWKKHFGDRFPCHLAEDKLDDAKRFAAPMTIKSDGKSA